MENNLPIPHSRLSTDFVFLEEHFPQHDIPDFPDSFCNLQNENLFPVEKLLFLHNRLPAARAAWMKNLEPALLLISRIILEKPTSFGLLLMRKEVNEGLVGEDDEIVLSPENAIKLIRQYIPNIDIDTDISECDSFSYTTLLPSQDRDTLYMDFALLKLASSPAVFHTVRVAALFAIAALINHKLTHSLEFRCARKGMFRQVNQPFETPLGATCGEAGTTWEYKVFGGKLYPICDKEGDLGTLRGLVVQSTKWNYHTMKLESPWMIQLFSEGHWKMHNPLRYPISLIAQRAFLAKSLTPLEPLGNDASPTKKRQRVGHGAVVVNHQPHELGKAHQCIRMCAGKFSGEGPGMKNVGKGRGKDNVKWALR